MTKHKAAMKLLSLLLSVLVVCGVVSCTTPVFAANYNDYLDAKAFGEKLLSETISEEREKAEIVSEVPEKREEYRKTYRRADGTYVAVLSSTPLHMLKDGEWVEIDNRLKARGANYTNTEGAFNIEFPKRITENKKITVENSGERIAFAINDISEALANITEEKSNEADIMKRDLEKAVSEITYENVKPHTDLQYVISSDHIKENIIVKNKSGLKDTYSFEIEKGNLTAVLSADKRLEFKNAKNETVFEIPSPIMTDAAGAVSHDIEVGILNAEAAVLTLVYTPSREWLLSNDREYPVTIDPVIAFPSDEEAYIEDTLLYSDSSDTETVNKNYINSPFGIIANKVTDGEKTLNGELLVKLNMQLFKNMLSPSVSVTDVNYAVSGVVSGGNILAKPVNGAWNASQITYSDVHPTNGSAPAITYGEAFDYYMGYPNSDDTDVSVVYFNITDLFNKWVSGELSNDGFAIVAENASVNALLIIGGLISTSQNDTHFNSYCTIDYVDTAGKNEAFEYLTQEVGRAGTASVNIFTRSLSLSRTDFSAQGLKMPAEISLNYNPAIYNLIKIYLTYEGEDAEPDYIKSLFPFGNNWLPSYFRMLFTLNELEYQYFTGEGSLVSFKLKGETKTETVDGIETENTVYSFEADDDNEGYKLELIDQETGVCYSNMKLTQPTGETEFFDEDGLLTKICEAEANSDGTYDEINLAVESTEGDYFTDGAGRRYKFIYNSETELLEEIRYLTPEGAQIKAGSTNNDMKITYSYDTQKNLTRVTYPDGKYVSYEYDTNGNLTKIKNIDGYSIEYTYDTLGKVTQITEMSGYVTGNYITLEQLNANQVKVTDEYLGSHTYMFGKDGVLNYTFDDKGNYLKSEYSQQGDESVVADYSWEIEPENMLQNGSFEVLSGSKPKYWSNAFNVTNTLEEPAVDYACVVSGTGIQTQTVDVSGENSYTFSVYAKSSFEDAITDIEIIAKDTENNTVSKTRRINPGENYERFSVTISSDNIVQVTVGFGGNDTVGEIIFDNAQLESGKGVAEYNYVENGDFRYLNSGVPKIWSNSTTKELNLNGKSVNAVVLNNALPYYTQTEDTYTLNDGISSVTQNIKINGKKGDIYSLNGWFNGLFDDNSFPNGFEEAFFGGSQLQVTKSLAQLKATYTYTENAEDEEGNEIENSITENFAVSFEPNNNSWQYAADSFALKGDTNNINVTVIVKNMPRKAYAANISLCRDFDSAFSDESDPSASSDVEISGCECGCEECLYGENCPCTGAINNDCTCPECKRKTTDTKDNFGNTLTATSTDGIRYIETTNTYTSDGNYLLSSSDESGNVTTFDYTTLNGFLASVTKPIGTANATSTTSYTYDELGNVTSVSETTNSGAIQKLEYVYTDDRLTKIITPNGKYSIAYDIWGQILSINVAVLENNEEKLIPLVQYTYKTGAKRTQVATATYINSSTNRNVYSYTYTEDGNLSKVLLNQKAKHNLTYDNLGELTKIENVGGRTVRYIKDGLEIYDSSEKLIYSSAKDGNGYYTEGELTYKENDSETNYDSATGKTTEIDSLEIENIARIKQAAKSDWFGRKTKEEVFTYNISEETEEVEAVLFGKISVEYDYAAAESGKTSTNIEKYINRVYDENETASIFEGYSYTYDKQNKIISEKAVKPDGTTSNRYSYEYDKLGQLVRFNSAVENKSYTYSYDNNGNILTKKEYSYTTDVLGEAVNTTTYGYDTAWKDKLSTVNGTSITYDNLGNPTSYLGKTFIWEGRNLVSYEDDNNSIVYEYDENGMRYRQTVTDKSDDSQIIYNYLWVDGKLVSMTVDNGESTMYYKYIYNSSDELTGYVVNSGTDYINIYYYLKNAQGDTTAVVDSSGKKIVSFNYDAFGKMTIEVNLEAPQPPEDSDPSLMLSYLIQQTFRTIAVTAATSTPFAYRGYCYDQYTGLYYLQSRYYDPETGRFINADDTTYLNATGTVLSCNLFAYCENDPVNYVDVFGNKKSLNSSEAVIYALLFLITIDTMQSQKTSFGIKSDSNKKGVISINLTCNSNGCLFSDIIFDFYMLIGDAVFDMMAIYATTIFYNEYYKKHNYKYKNDKTDKREFLFSDDCVSNEIKQHVLGYWYAKGKISMRPMTIVLFVGSGFNKVKLENSCKIVDIAEQDAAKVRDRTAFGYFSGIRDCYMYTEADPYWQTGKIRTYQNVRNTWKASKIPTYML